MQYIICQQFLNTKFTESSITVIETGWRGSGRPPFNTKSPACLAEPGPLTIIGHIALSKPMWLPGGEETPVLLTGGVWRPLPDHGVICVDTGCGKGGCLTAMTIEDDRYTLTDVPEDA